MNLNTELTQTPLQNLFCYIRDLYNARQDCLDFEQEPGNPKTPGTNYWEVGAWMDLARRCASKRIGEFVIDGWGEAQGNPEYLLKIKRIPLPPAPVEAAPVEAAQDKASPVEAAPDKAAPVDEAPDKKVPDADKALKEYEKKYALPLEVNECYDALHSLYYELRGRTGRRLHLSFGLVEGEISGRKYRNFLFHIPLRLKLKNQEIRIEPDTFAYKIFCEQYFSELLDEERKHEVLLAVDRFNARTLEYCMHPDFIRQEYFERGWEMLSVFPRKTAAFFKGDAPGESAGDPGESAGGPENPPKEPTGAPEHPPKEPAGALDYSFHKTARELTLSFSPIVQTKVVADQIAISRDASAIIRSLNELQSQGDLNSVPDFFRKLFSLPEGDMKIEDLIEPEKRFLFPLPYNQEQFEIACRLREQDAVTVKGPPGTGKSHTIANLISHFVSEGKSILVVSHNAKALSVLRDKLPKGIQDLAVSLVNEGKGNEGLKASVSAIIRHISQRYDAGRIESLEEQLSALENKYALLLNDMYQIVRANGERLEIVHPATTSKEDRSAYEWAFFLHEEAPHIPVLLRDAVDYQAPMEDFPEKLQTLTVIANRFQPDDFDLIHYHFLQDHDFPEVQQLRRIEVRLEEISQAIELDEYAKVDPNVADDAFMSEFQQVETQWANAQKSSIAASLIQSPEFDRAALRKLLKDQEPLREQVSAAEETLLPYDLDLTPLQGADPDVLYRQVNQLILKFGDNPQMGWMTRNLLDKPLKPFFACKVNYIAAAELPEFRLIETAINHDRCEKQLRITIQNFLKKFSIKAEEIKSVYKELDLLDAFMDSLAGINIGLKRRNLPQLDPREGEFDAKCKYIRGLGDYVDYRKIRDTLAQAKARLIDHDHAHPLLFNIAKALEFVNRANYELYLSQYREKRAKQPASIRFDQLHKEVGRTLPQTVHAIKENGIKGIKQFPTVEDIARDLFYARISGFLDHIVSKTRGSAGLLAQMQTVKRGIERQTAELISYKAWFNKAASVNDLQKAALNAWLNDLINIGKGFGKNTARNMASAIRNMQIAKEAVPIWIMPQEAAIAFFPDASPGQFDLLIIDEASQCDISSLNLVYRCKKTLIVGDENQTSVIADRSCFSIDRTNELLDKYLISHRFKTQFDVNNKSNSIYTLSGVIYPNIVTLTEHFRCLPEIIGYSSRYMYNGEIVALKTATERPFGEPLGIVYVEDNPDAEEKPLIVRKVAETIEEYILKFREGALKRLPTIGIITLDSANQAHHQALLREIAGNELIKQYEDTLELLIGTSREFQGDERDVMLLTITASHTIRKEGERYTFKPPRAATTEEYMRIYNVAASRARERSVLFHSIHPDAVAIMNPECYRKKLIDYYNTPRQAPAASPTLPSLLEQVDVYGGDFQNSVCRFLYEQGWGDYLHPQLEIGKYRIDFGLIAGNRKLAIECDGDMHAAERIHEDIARQLILERANWNFFRIQSTDWFYRREAVGEALLSWIRDNTAA